MIDLSQIKGVGPVTLKKLNTLGIFNSKDLLEYFPSKYYDLSNISPIRDVIEGEYCLIKGKILKDVSLSRIRKNFSIIKNQIFDDSGVINVVWFNEPYVTKLIKKDCQYLFFGKITTINGKLSISNPKIDDANSPKRLFSILPIYKTRNLIAQNSFYNLIKALIEEGSYKKLTSIIKNTTADDYAQAIKKIHVPVDRKEYISGVERFSVELIARQIAAYKIMKKKNLKAKRYNHSYKFSWIDDAVVNLEFKLSQSQNVAVKEIFDALIKNSRMNRILIGDVGSGKTIVAFLSALPVLMSGGQVAFMAPTEILTNQHFANAKKFFEKYSINCAILTSSTTKDRKKEILEEIKNGKINLIFSTHAILNSRIEFFDLRYIIIDETHRFGVKQRGKLEAKALDADTLTMSATPIPRSVSLALYGDLEVSRIEKREEQKNNITTYLAHESKLKELVEYIKNKNNKIFIICPSIGDSEGIDLFSIKSVYQKLVDYNVFSKDEISVIYGNMKSLDKKEIMSDFDEGKIRILVATTVIEVGIDIKNVNTMVILNAERFGLATLHQLRGRIGRQGEESECFLITNDIFNKRLIAIKNCYDGDQLANIDAEIRGFGDFIGEKQHGKNSLPIKINLELIKKSREYIDMLSEKELDDLAQNEDMAKYIKDVENITLN